VPSLPADVRSNRPTGLEVRPFRALTYRQRDPASLARVSSPAYDLVTPAGRERLAEADPHNVVRLILPGTGPADGSAPGPPAGSAAERSAQQAAATLRTWQEDGVLVADRHPALWLYELAPSGGVPATLGWLGAVALPPAGSGAVLPHEDTYAPAVEGRRALLAATRTDLEPIVLAHDPSDQVATLTGAARTGPPTLELTDSDGVAHRLWRIEDPAVVRDVRGALAGTRAVIADGHHRFAAASAHHRAEPGSPGADAVLALVTSSGAGGLRVEAIHRVLPDLPLADAVRLAGRGFAVGELAVPPGGDVAGAARGWLATAAPGSFLVSDGSRLVSLSRPDPAVRAAVPSEAPPSWRALDVVLAHHGLVETLWGLPDDPSAVHIAHDVPAALRGAAERSGTALLLRPASPGDVAAVARAGARMPRKSTLFVPKPRTGLVLRPLEA
jgi:uncharacterized protein (DUF1015 family)